MASIVKRKKGKGFFYYLKHGTGKRQKEAYLGKAIPADIEQRRQDFLLEFYRDEWTPKLEQIRKNYSAELKRTPKEIIRQNMDSFVISFTYNTQKIEGSTLTFHETANLLVHGVTPAQKPEGHMVETKLHQQVFDEMLERKKILSEKTMIHWHAKMFNKTKPQFAGQIRDYPVGVSGSKAVFPDWEQVPKLLKEYFAWYKKSKGDLNPVELAALAHLKFTIIHPFGDGNGRTARLIMNYVLDNFGYPLLDIKFADRKKYARSQERAQLSGNDMYFLQWFMKYYLKAHLKYFRGGSVTSSRAASMGP